MKTAQLVPPSGNPLIDRQHGRLNELIHVATLAARDPGGPEPFSLALGDFRQALAHHFDVEKVIFSGAGFDAAAGHERAHATILHRLDEVIGGAGGLATVPSRHRVLDELEQILLDHEMVEDAAYWDAVRAHALRPSLGWSELMALGIGWVDQDHRAMVDLLNQLSEAARLGDEAGCRRLLTRFQAEAIRHFEAEERHLEAAGKAVEPHRADHQRMLADVANLMLEEAGGARILVDHYLRFWVMEHILGIDRRDLAQ